MAEKTVSARITLDASQASAALRGFGDQANVSFDLLTRKSREAGAALDDAGGNVQGFERNMRNAFGQLGFQVQDVVVQLQQGTSVLTTFTQQGLQLAGAFGPIPALVTGVAASVVAVGAAVLGFNREAENLTGLAGGIASVFQTMGKAAEDAKAQIEGLTEAQKNVVAEAAKAESEQQTTDLRSKLPDLMAQLGSQYRSQEYERRIPEFESTIPEERAPLIAGAEREAAQRFDQARGQIDGAVQNGEVGRVTELLTQMGLQGTAAGKQILEVARDNAGRKVLQETVAADRSPANSPYAGFDLSAQANNVNVPFNPAPVTGLETRLDRIGMPKPRDEGALDAIMERERAEDERNARRAEAERERNEAKARAEQERAAREVEARQRVIQAAQQEAASAERLLAAKKADFEQTKATGEAKGGEAEASKKVQREIESERRIREASRTLSGQALEQVKQLEAQRVAAAQATDELNAAEREYLQTRKESAAVQERLLELQNQAVPPSDPRVAAQLAAQRSLPQGATPEEQAEAARLAGLNYDREQAARESEKFADQQAQIFLRPFEDLASRISSLTTQVFDEFLATGTLSAEKLAENIATSTRSITSNLLGNLVSAPLNQAVAQLGPILNKAMQKGGQRVGGALTQFARDNPLTAGLAGGTLGITAGNTLTAMRGGNQFGSTVGGTLGAGGGFMLGNMLLPGVGGFIGAGLGGLGGGFLGGLFGGEKNLGNDRARLDYWTSVGTSWQDSNSSPENRQAVNAFASEVDSLVEALAGLGATVGNLNLRFEAGNKTGLVFNGQQYGSQEDLMAGVIKFVGGQAQGLSENQQTVVRNTRAGSVQEFASDLAFAEQVDRVSRNLGPFATQLADLEDSFTGMKVRAEQLGLATDGLSAAYARQRREIREQAQSQIDAFVSGGGIKGQIAGIKAQAEDLTQMGRELGLATGQIAGAMRKQIAEIRDAVKDQVDAFKSGGRSAAGQAMIALKQQLEDVQEAAREAGISTAGLTQAYNQQRAAIRGAVADQVDAFRQQGGAGFKQAMTQLQQQFEEVSKSARDVGLSTAGLTQAYRRQLEEIRQAARTEYQGFTRDQNPVADAIRQLDEQWENARAIAQEMGFSTKDVDRAWSREFSQVRENVFDQLRAFSRGPAVAQFDELRKRFLDLRQAAQAVGASVTELDEAFERQRKQMLANAQAAVTQAERGVVEQTRGLQDVFSNLIEPLKQATGPFGIGQGITAPRATMTGGIEQFREQLALARQGDVDAIQSLTSLGQQTIGVARQYGASGSEFAAVFKEVNSGLVEMQSRLQDRQLEALRGLKDVGRETLDEMVKLRREGIASVVEELERLRLEFRQLQDRVA